MTARRQVTTGVGGLDVPELVEVEVPPTGPGEVTIEVPHGGDEPGRLQALRSGRSSRQSRWASRCRAS